MPLRAGIALLALALVLAAWLFVMNASSHVPASPPKSPFDLAALSDAPATEDGFADVDWQYWCSINPDIIAWVNVEGTRINHPIMRAPAEDPAFYLHHDIYGHYSVYGVPYLDRDVDDLGSLSLNAIIYGHHMDDGSMFSDFAEYLDDDYAHDHASICLQTPAGKQRLRVSFVSIIDGDSTAKATTFPDEEAFASWFEEARNGAEIVLDDERVQDKKREEHAETTAVEEDGSFSSEQRSAEADQQPTSAPAYCVTFCTCSYHRFDNERTLVVCVPEP